MRLREINRISWNKTSTTTSSTTTMAIAYVVRGPFERVSANMPSTAAGDLTTGQITPQRRARPRTALRGLTCKKRHQRASEIEGEGEEGQQQ